MAGFIDRERVAMLETALDASSDLGLSRTADPATMATRARLLAGLAQEILYGQQHRDRRAALCDEALALARAIDDKATLFYVLTARFFAINSPTTVPRRLTDTFELLTLAETIDDPQIRFMAHSQRARVILETGDLTTARIHAAAAEAVADELGQPQFRWMALWTRFGEEHLAGRLDEAARVAQEAFDVGTASGQPDAAIIHLVQRWMLNFERGCMDEMEPELAALAARVEEVPGIWTMLALLHCEGGRPERAREVFAPIADRGYFLPDDLVWLPYSQLAAEIVHQLDDRAGAAVLLDLMSPHAALFSIVAGMSMGYTAHYLGLLQTTLRDLDVAVAHFADAAATCDRVGARAHLGRTQVAWARALLARRAPGDVDQARSLLTTAMAEARDRGYVTVQRRAGPLLDQL
jgi:hypothetical protein